MRWVIVAVLLSPTAALATSESAARERAIELCQQQKKNADPGEWDQGPCISNGEGGLTDWVVDLAHVPRRPVDDQPSNQCSAFAEGRIKKFVELDTKCKVIRTHSK
jgi:hypothetical protein